MSTLSLLAFGFWLGMRHATDADHVVAVSTIVARTKKLGTSWLLGAFWGLGHTITIFAVGSAIILFHLTIPPRLGLSMELAVGLALIALGIFNMAGYSLGSLGLPQHSHPHSHANEEHHHDLLAQYKGGHSHLHAHLHEVELGWLRRHLHNAGAFQLARSLIVGLVHGLAGSAAVALLVLATIGEPRAALLYLLIFGIGTLFGMLTLSTFMELALLRATAAWFRLDKIMTAGTGLLSLLFGAWVVYEMSFRRGLFTSHPNWTPQ